MTCRAGGQIVARIGAESLPATLVVTDEDLNLCRLSVPRMEAAVIAASGEEPKAGDKVYASASTRARELSVVEGTVKDVKRRRAEPRPRDLDAGRARARAAARCSTPTAASSACSPTAIAPAANVALPATRHRADAHARPPRAQAQ